MRPGNRPTRGTVAPPARKPARLAPHAKFGHSGVASEPTTAASGATEGPMPCGCSARSLHERVGQLVREVKVLKAQGWCITEQAGLYEAVQALETEAQRWVKAMETGLEQGGD